jgi:competence/damage-inducible protein CinA-like protein
LSTQRSDYHKGKHMLAEILATGDEIRSGALVDSNSAYVAEKLETIGIPVTRHICVGDDMEALVSIFKEISKRADICVATGGLGPTTDDLSSEAAALAVDQPQIMDPRALADIEAFFRDRKREMTDSNKKQAMLPQTAEAMYNPIGTAPGFCMKINMCTFFFLPGVPPEMKRMLSREVLPRIQKMPGAFRGHCLVRSISTFGLTESVTGEKVADLALDYPDIKLGLRAKFPEIHVKLYLNGTDLSGMQKRLASASEWVENRLGRYVLSTEGDSLQAVVGDLLRQYRATLAVAESCTGGRIANWLTDVPGSSDYFLFSGVTYSNTAKTKILGVASDVLKRYGAVHEETARAMAAGARRVSGATYGIATTGIAGPGGGSDDKPVGTVCIALATPNRVVGRRLFFPFGQRSMNKTIFGMAALDMLRKELLNP